MKEKKKDIITSKCICEMCDETYTNYPNWIKSMSTDKEEYEIGYNSITLMAAEYKGRLWLSGYVTDRRYQAYASGYFARYCPECGKKLEN